MSPVLTGDRESIESVKSAENAPKTDHISDQSLGKSKSIAIDPVLCMKLWILFTQSPNRRDELRDVYVAWKSKHQFHIVRHTLRKYTLVDEHALAAKVESYHEHGNFIVVTLVNLKFLPPPHVIFLFSVLIGMRPFRRDLENV